jgi:hypothetical protein
MSISAEDRAKRYPTLYHMATYGAWPSIAKYGLLGSSALVELFEVPQGRHTELLGSQRKEGITIKHSKHGEVTLRDQKPLSAKSLDRCLIDCNAQEWYQILNERVFFWLSRDRLKTLMSAKEYLGKFHSVLSIDTASLLKHYEKSVELAHMNTGNTRPFAHPRGRDTFLKLPEYPYEKRRKLSDYSSIVELTVLRGVPDVRDYVIRVEHARVTNGVFEVKEVVYQR